MLSMSLMTFAFSVDVVSPVPARIWLMHTPFGDATPRPPVAFAATVPAALQSVASGSLVPQKQLKTPDGFSFEQSAASEAAVTLGFRVPVAPAVPDCGDPI